ncbi:hypothetical protein A2U01_0111775, partial [Trifolium medium]|nr:hypothetical protein [Trifolium medium]
GGAALRAGLLDRVDFG